MLSACLCSSLLYVSNRWANNIYFRYTPRSIVRKSNSTRRVVCIFAWFPVTDVFCRVYAPPLYIYARSHVCNTCAILYYGRVLRITTIKKKKPTYVNFVAGTIFSVPIPIRYNGENEVYDFGLKGDILRENRVGNSIVGQKKTTRVYM